MFQRTFHLSFLFILGINEIFGQVRRLLTFFFLIGSRPNYLLVQHVSCINSWRPKAEKRERCMQGIMKILHFCNSAEKQQAYIVLSVIIIHLLGQQAQQRQKNILN